MKASLGLILTACVATSVDVKPAVQRPPIAIPAGQQLAAIQFDRALFVMQRGEVVGEYVDRLLTCDPKARNLYWNTGKAVVSDSEIAAIFFDTMKVANMNVVGDPKRLFVSRDSPDAKRPNYLIGARVDQLRMKLCDHFVYMYPGLHSGIKQSGEASIRVTWQVYDVLARKIVHETITEGYSSESNGVPNGELRLIYEAFASATRNLSFDPSFIAGLSLPVYTIADIRSVEQASLQIEAQ
jgi:hypothetical protein